MRVILANLEKYVPAISTACTEIGNHFGDFLNDTIDKAFEKILDIIAESPVVK